MSLFILGQCGIPWQEALHEIPAALGNQLMACHWMSLGVEIEPIMKSATAPTKQDFDALTNRQKSWDLEQL